MQKIEFLGAGGNEVTGSCYHVIADDSSEILVDFGMFQGSEQLVKKNYDLLSFHAPALQAVFLTHAHLDHCGRLPLLVFGGFLGKIYMTEPTRSLIEIILSDSARIAEKDMKKEPLYTSDEVRKVLSMIETVKYNTEITVGSFKAIFRDAGHILGSSSIEITDISGDTQQKIVFSGDLGNTPQHIVKPTHYIESADFVVMESTYGDSSHPQEDPMSILQEEINTVEETGGVLLIPVFAIERTQEILHMIHHLKKDGLVGKETPVFLDSPMGIDATSVYMDFMDYYNDEIKQHENIPFNFEGLVITDNPFDSRNIIREKGAKVIVAGSGMMSGGRIMRHAEAYLPDDTTRVLFVGYQAEETMGREILQGAQSVRIQDKKTKVRATISEIKTLRSHADQPRLIKWLGHINGVKKVFITHGEKNQREALAEKIKEELHIPGVFLPENEEEINLN
jgi:metallo-beta-lactamase family protein